MNRRVAVRAIIVREGKLLAVQLKPYEGSTILDEPYWATVGGGVDPGEALIPALKREVIEETGIKPVVGKLIYIQQFAHSDKEQMEFFFHITNTDDFLDIDLAKTTHGAIEIEKIEFIDPKSVHILPTFLKEVDLEADITHNAPTQIFNYL